jgi:3-mercaptopyruvate sulfurtransferase SseA
MGKARSMLSRFLKRFMASSSTPAIAHEDLVRTHQDGSCTVVDVREPHEYAGGHIPGALNHPCRNSILPACRAASASC